MAQLLVIEDNVTMREGIVEILSREGHDVKAAPGGREGIELFQRVSPDFVITDLKMEGVDGVEVLRKVREISPNTLVMIITAFGTIETAVEAMKLGAFDFITKPFPPDLLRVKVSQGLEVAQVRAENQYLRKENQRGFPQPLVGRSTEIQRVHQQISRVAPTDSSVLIIGESGTGKELFARAIHTQSHRSQKPFIKVDCSALAEGVLESELFGHERGAFTGAIQRKPGRFELADGGTIFLDEIGEISPSVQLKLLRVLQDHCFERVGGTRTINADVRVVSATNKNLQEEVQKGRFREDLFYRLHIVPIELPPLRDRKDDIPLLVDHFCQNLARKNGQQKRVTNDAMRLLETHPWPGNIRELENLIERLYILTPHAEIGTEDLPETLTKTNYYNQLNPSLWDLPLTEAMEDLERKLILRAYEKAGGVKTKTAQLLKIKTSALYYKLEKYGIYSREKDEDQPAT